MKRLEEILPRERGQHRTAVEPLRQAPDLAVIAERLLAIVRDLEGAEGSQPASMRDAGKTSAGRLIDGTVHTRGASNPDERSSGRAEFALLARKVYSLRRKRSLVFGNHELFGEPAWDILLDLYIAEDEGKPVSVSSACIGSASPPTTGLRWLGILAEKGLIVREHDPEDQRRVLVRLTDKGLQAMDEYFASAAVDYEAGSQRTALDAKSAG